MVIVIRRAACRLGACVGAGRRPLSRSMRRKFAVLLFAIFGTVHLADAASATTPAVTVDAVSGLCTLTAVC